MNAMHASPLTGLLLSCSGLLLAGTALSQGAPGPRAPGAPPAAKAAPVATPRTADGHPNLSGFWAPGGISPFTLGPAGGPAVFDGGVRAALRNGDISNLTNDGSIGRRVTDNLPLYKPQYWDRVNELDHTGNKSDPYIHCMPPAPPRLGAPAQIIQMPNQVLFFYRVIFQRNDFRIIPFGKRTHPLDPDGTWTGDPVASWDGDTLVVETEGFNDQGWLDPAGYLHGYNLKVTERFHRVGNEMTYDVHVEDPDYLQRPWDVDQQPLVSVSAPGSYLEDAPPCSDRDSDHIVGTQREM
jgi:hypothetical protein